MVDIAYTAQIVLFAGNFAPRGWAFCQGQILDINSYPALYSLLGTVYGGNGRNTFGLPDLRSRVPVGTGTGPGLSTITLGELSGQEYTQITAGNLPTIQAPVQFAGSLECKLPVNTSTTADSNSPENAFLRSSPAQPFYNTASSPAAYTGAGPVDMGNLQGTAVFSGASQPINNREPFLGMNYIICLDGIFPSRS